MQDTKISNSYYMDSDIVAWIAEQAEKEKRSASWYLNELVRQIKDNKKQSKTTTSLYERRKSEVRQKPQHVKDEA